MAFCSLHYYNSALQMQTGVNVILPNPGTTGPFRVLYLLHGMSDDFTIWARRTNIDRYAEGLPVIIVMPDGARSFYANARRGPAYETAIVRDLVGFIDQTFPTVRGPKGRGIGGNSMGGYGAVRLAVRNPAVFGSAHGLSSAFDFGHGHVARYGDIKETELILADAGKGSEFDLYQLWEDADRATMPALRIDCGVDDFLIEPNRDFHRHLDSLAIPHEYAEHAGAHNWEYWDEHIRTGLAWHCKQFGLA